MTAISKISRLFANLMFIGGGLLCLVILGLVVLHHDRLLTSGPRAAFFLGLPLTGIAVSLVALRLTPPARLALGLSLSAFAVSLYAFEMVMTLRPKPQDKSPSVDFDTRTKYEVVQDLRQQGINAYPSVFPKYLMRTSATGALRSPLSLDGNEVLMLGGVPKVKTVLCNESGPYVVYDADEMGFVNPRGLWAAKELDVAAVGDSFTQGYCVSPEKSFVGLIRASHPLTLSLGMSGNGPLIELASLKEFLPRRRPRTVVWFFYAGNDLPGDLEIERRSPLLMRYLDPSFRQNLEAHSTEAGNQLAHFVDTLVTTGDSRSETNAGTLQTLIGIAGLSKVREILNLPSTTDDVPDYALFRAIMAEAKREVTSWNGCLVLVYLPSRVVGDSSELTTIHTNVRAIVGDLGIPFIDGYKALRAHPDPLSLFPFRQANHYHEAGHQLIADVVLRELTAKQCR